MVKHKNTRPPIGRGELADERVLTTREVLARIPITRATLWRMAREGRFPAPIQLTSHRIGWRLSAVLAWLADREAHPIAARPYFPRRTNSAAAP